MTNPKNRRTRKDNRATDPFGGPSNRNNKTSLIFVVAALALFIIVQWSGGDLSSILNAPAADPTQIASAPTTLPSPTREPTAGSATADEDADTTEDEVADEDAAAIEEDESPIVEATATEQPRPTNTPRPTEQPTPTANAPPVQRASDLPTIDYDDLPPQAHDTIALIESDGPFPYSRDGVTFQNRERILPRHPEGYYREYTVITPGSDDRGARRIVAGDAGEMYYTDDHYDSFREIIFP
jgi:ribonuclease T1